MTARKVFVIAVAFTCVGFAAGCATVAKGPQFSEAKATAATGNEATVYVFRKYAEPTAWGATIRFDDQEIATLNQGGFTWGHLAAGHHTIRGVWAGMSGQKDSFIDLNVKPGITYYIELTGISSLAGAAPSMTPGTTSLRFQVGSGLKEIDPIVAEAKIAQCCRYQNQH